MTNEKVHKALADKTRRKILEALQMQSFNVSELANLCGTSKPNISQHLRTLKDAELVTDEKRGMHVFYSITENGKTKTEEDTSIQSQVFHELHKILEAYQCESYIYSKDGIDSSEEGTFFVFNENETILSFDYLFRLKSIGISFLTPASLLSKENSFSYEDELENFHRFIDDYLQKTVLPIIKSQERTRSLKSTILIHPTIMEHMKKRFKHSFFPFEDTNTLNRIQNFFIKGAKKVIAFDDNYFEDRDIHSDEEIEKILIEIFQEQFTSGPLRPLYADPNVLEITAKAYDKIYARTKDNKIELTEHSFPNEEAFDNFVKKLDAHYISSFESELRKRSNVHFKTENQDTVVILTSPLSVHGTYLHIEKCYFEKKNFEWLSRQPNIKQSEIAFIKTLLHSKMNIVFSGSIGSGKTSFLNACLYELEDEESVFAIEQHTGLMCDNNNITYINESSISYTDSHVLDSLLHLKNKRFALDELQKPTEVFKWLQIMNNNPGSITTMHAGSPAGTMTRLKYLIEHSDEYRFYGMQKEILKVIDVIIHLEKDNAGNFYIESMSEIQYEEYKNDFVYSNITKEESHNIFRVTKDFYNKLKPVSIPSEIKILPTYNE